MSSYERSNPENPTDAEIFHELMQEAKFLVDGAVHESARHKYDQRIPEDNIKETVVEYLGIDNMLISDLLLLETLVTQHGRKTEGNEAIHVYAVPLLHSDAVKSEVVDRYHQNREEELYNQQTFYIEHILPNKMGSIYSRIDYNGLYPLQPVGNEESQPAKDPDSFTVDTIINTRQQAPPIDTNYARELLDKLRDWPMTPLN
ncbi:hypothetical protein KC867_00100 [Candidatus Saccharibacteria bacterium]|nr:hypothetical protein [Candidatus Saccharibacteria bacterium]